MKSPDECRARAEALEALAEQADGWRRDAYLEMAAWSRRSAARRDAADGPDA